MSGHNTAKTSEDAVDLAKVIAGVTGLWDEPLDEVHDIPPIVNAIIAAGWAPRLRSDIDGGVS